MLSIPKYPEQYAQHFPAIFYLLCCASQHHVLSKIRPWSLLRFFPYMKKTGFIGLPKVTYSYLRLPKVT